MSRGSLQVSRIACHLLKCDECRISRKSMPKYLGEDNMSLHSVISNIQNSLSIPVQSRVVKGMNGMKEYWIERGDAYDYKYNREVQKVKQKEAVDGKRSDRFTKALKRIADSDQKPTSKQLNIMRGIVEQNG